MDRRLNDYIKHFLHQWCVQHRRLGLRTPAYLHVTVHNCISSSHPAPIHGVDAQLSMCVSVVCVCLCMSANKQFIDNNQILIDLCFQLFEH